MGSGGGAYQGNIINSRIYFILFYLFVIVGLLSSYQAPFVYSMRYSRIDSTLGIPD